MIKPAFFRGRRSQEPGAYEKRVRIFNTDSIKDVFQAILQEPLKTAGSQAFLEGAGAGAGSR